MQERRSYLTLRALGSRLRVGGTRRRRFLFYGMLAALLFLVFLPRSPGYVPLCATCHAVRGEYASWKQSPHAQVQCISCHSSGGVTGALAMPLQAAGNLLSWVTFRSDSPQATVLDRRCLSCHQDILGVVLEGKQIRMSHDEVISARWRCVDCHSTTGHPQAVARATYPTMDKCFTCHGREASNVCGQCHVLRGFELVKEEEEALGEPEPEVPNPLLQRRCTVCHNLEPVRSARKTEAEWRASLARMKLKGARLLRGEENELIRYLQETFPSGSPSVAEAVYTKRLVEKECTACHGMERVEGSKKNEGQWLQTVERMKEKGAIFRPEEVLQIVVYLAAKYPGQSASESEGLKILPTNERKMGWLAHGPSWDKSHGLADLDTCRNCHLPKAAEEGGGSNPTLEKVCTACHDLERVMSAKKKPDEWKATIARMEGKGCAVTPAEEAEILGFLAAATFDGKKFMEENCTACHDTERIKKSKKTADEWKATITRMIGKGAKLAPADIDPYVGWLASKYSPTAPPEVEEGETVPETNPFCQKCHEVDTSHSEEWPIMHGSVAKLDSSSCQNCHRPNFCSSCHRVEMPHADSYLDVHGKDFKDKGAQVCLRCHFAETCDECHAPHQRKG